MNYLLALLTLCCACVSSFAVEGVAAKPLVLVAPFENLSGRLDNLAVDDRLPSDQAINTVQVVITDKPQQRERMPVRDRLAETSRSTLEDLIVNLGAVVVERSRADGLFSEDVDPAQARDPKEAARLAGSTGATAVALGTITAFTVDGATTTAQVRVRVVSGVGTLVFSRELDGSVTERGSDALVAAVRAAIRSLEGDHDFRAAVLPNAGTASSGATIEVLIQPTQSHCEVEVDGAVMGYTPGRFALPAGQRVRVKVSKPGFGTWEKTVIAHEGLRLMPEILPK